MPAAPPATARRRTRSSAAWAALCCGLVVGGIAASTARGEPPKNPALDTGAAEILYNAGVNLLRRSDARGAIQQFIKCIGKDPKHCLCYRALGIAHGHASIEHAEAAIGYLQAYVDLCPEAKDVEQFHEVLSHQPPRAPRGLDRCQETLRLERPLLRRAGEAIRYHVDINGISMGIVDFKIERNGLFENQPVTEYRTLFNIDSLVSTFLPVTGRAGSLVPLGTHVPVRAMNHFEVSGRGFSEEIRFDKDGHWIYSDHTRDETVTKRHRRYPLPAVDLLTAFYGLRSLARDAAGCAIFFGSGHAHTIWVIPDGTENVRTPVGLRPADRYKLRYASEISRKIYEALIWLSQDEDRLPYKAIILGGNRLEARVHLYERGVEEPAAE